MTPLPEVMVGRGKIGRSNPSEYGYDLGCLEGVNPFDLATVPTRDGVQHPADR